MDEEASVTIESRRETAELAASADEALRAAAARSGVRTVFADSSDRAERGLGQPRKVTYVQADAIVDGISGRLRDMGLEAGDVIALQMPNTIEAPLLILAAWRAALVPCLMPLLWRLDEIGQAFSQVRPKAAVTVAAYGGDRPAETLGEAATEHTCVRHVLGFGDELPEGVTPIDDWFATPEPAEASGPDRRGETSVPQDQLALLTWAVGREGSYPVARTHRQLVLLANMFVSQFSLSRRDVLLNPYPYTNTAAVAGQLVAPLLSECETVLHLPFDLDVFLQQLKDHDVTAATVPAPVVTALEERGSLRSENSELSRLGCIWPSPHGIRSGPGLFEPSLPVIDIHGFSELALLVRKRPAGADPSLLPLGKVYAPEDAAPDEPILETRVRGSVADKESRHVLTGTLTVRGSTVPAGPYIPEGEPLDNPRAPKAEAHGFIDTGIGCVVDETIAGHFRCQKSEDVIYHGGAMVPASELDRLYSGFSEFLDAAAFVLDDAIIGERIFAAVVPRPELSPSLERLRKFLAEKRVAPYKTPDQLVIVKSIPRSGDGHVLRDQLLAQI